MSQTPEQKECYITKRESGYGWFLKDTETHPSDVCIMAVHCGESVSMERLRDFRNVDEIIDSEDILAIELFDCHAAEEGELHTIQALAKKLNIKLVTKEDLSHG